MRPPEVFLRKYIDAPTQGAYTIFPTTAEINNKLSVTWHYVLAWEHPQP
jgi:hypothetical protein